MSIEAAWYASHVDGRPPKMRRLSRLPLSDQWRAAVDLAIAYTERRAGYRKTYVARTRERYWWWPAEGYALRSRNAVQSDWWLIPQRVEERAFLLCRRACETALRGGLGRCSQDEVAAVLRLWSANGHWRRIACTVRPRHTPAKRRRAMNTRAPRRVTSRL